MAGEEAKRVSAGDRIPYTPGSDVAAGDVVVLNKLIGIADAKIAASATGSLAITGVFEVPKDTSTAFAIGEDVYWDEADTEAQDTADSGANEFMGKAWEAAGSSDATMKVLLTPRGT